MLKVCDTLICMDHCAVSGHSNLGLAAVAYGMFYKVDCLALGQDIALISQVLLDDGKRIIIPRGILKLTPGTTVFLHVV